MSTYIFAALMVMILASLFVAAMVWLSFKDHEVLAIFAGGVGVILVFVSWGIIIANGG